MAGHGKRPEKGRLSRRLARNQEIGELKRETMGFKTPPNLILNPWVLFWVGGPGLRREREEGEAGGGRRSGGVPRVCPRSFTGCWGGGWGLWRRRAKEGEMWPGRREEGSGRGEEAGPKKGKKKGRREGLGGPGKGGLWGKAQKEKEDYFSFFFFL